MVSCQGGRLDDPAPSRSGLTLQPASQCVARGDLKEKDDVLCSLEFAYRYRDVAELSRLMDPDFVFFFSPDDVGGTVPTQWDRATELQATSAMFGSPPTGIRSPAGWESTPNHSPLDVQPATWGIIKNTFRLAPQTATSIHLDLTFDFGDATWLQVAPALYQKFAYYEIEVAVGEDTLRSESQTPASFFVHYTEANGDSVWRLVEWRDDP
jgi:hypothetical protein